MSEIPSQPLSKTAIKKAAKAERLASIKQERRAREREAKKEKRRIRAEKRAAGELDDTDDRRTKKRKLDFGGTVVVDLGFDELMSDKASPLCSWRPVRDTVPGSYLALLPALLHPWLQSTGSVSLFARAYRA